MHILILFFEANFVSISVMKLELENLPAFVKIAKLILLKTFKLKWHFVFIIFTYPNKSIVRVLLTACPKLTLINKSLRKENVSQMQL